MRKVATILAVAVALGCFGAPEGHATKRIAFVVGNDDYATLPKLQRAANGARAIGMALEKIGFTVIAGENLARRAMSRQLAEFRRQLEPGDEALFFFAGHAVRYRGRNFLLPVDFPKSDQSEIDVEFVGIALDAVLRSITMRRARVGVVILDASRFNPLPTCTRCIPRHGLARVDIPLDLFLLYSASVGRAALDKLSHDDRDPHSLFVRSLIPLLKDPKLTIHAVAKRLQHDVHALAQTVGFDQRPAYFHALPVDYHLAR